MRAATLWSLMGPVTLAAYVGTGALINNRIVRPFQIVGDFVFIGSLFVLCLLGAVYLRSRKETRSDRIGYAGNFFFTVFWLFALLFLAGWTSAMH